MSWLILLSPVAAIAYGANCGDGCLSSSIKGTLIYFPPGTYLISSPINAYYYSQLVGDVSSASPFEQAEPKTLTRTEAKQLSNYQDHGQFYRPRYAIQYRFPVL